MATCHDARPKERVMGALERMMYRRLSRQAAAFRHSLAATKPASESTDAPGRSNGGRARPRAVAPVFPDRIAASLMFARVFDQRPDLLHAIRTANPVIMIDVADLRMLEQLAAVWLDILFGGATVLEIDGAVNCLPSDLKAAHLVVMSRPTPAQKGRREKDALHTLYLALPILAMSPAAATHLPDVLIRAATETIAFPPMDQTAIVRTIRIVTGRRFHDAIEEAIVARADLSSLMIAVRFDRTPAQCIGELRRLTAASGTRRHGRDLSLSELHGLGTARAWAEAAIADIAAWKVGRLPWSEVSSAIALSGPPGCGKTTFASVFCREAGLHMVSASHAKWQGSGEGHLGHLLRAMRQDFDEARAKPPSCVFIDEIDSFPDRAGVIHAWRDYVVEVVNALLAEIDGIKGREGVVVIGASNQLSRCEPALLRAGRLETIVTIGVPNEADLESMFRVRLNGDLEQDDLSGIVELSLGLLGADVERVVKDARRAARREGARPLSLGDLRAALVSDDDRSAEALWRSCVHEAGHLVADVIHFGAGGVFASTARLGAMGGRSVRTAPDSFPGTPEAYRRRLQVILAGRAGEELLLGAPSHGAGGVRGSDLANATACAAAMAGSLGLIGADHLTYFSSRDETAELLASAAVRRAVRRELKLAFAAVKQLLKSERPAVQTVARWLFERGRVGGSEVTPLLSAAQRLRSLEGFASGADVPDDSLASRQANIWDPCGCAGENSRFNPAASVEVQP